MELTLSLEETMNKILYLVQWIEPRARRKQNREGGRSVRAIAVVDGRARAGLSERKHMNERRGKLCAQMGAEPPRPREEQAQRP